MLIAIFKSLDLVPEDQNTLLLKMEATCVDGIYYTQ